MFASNNVNILFSDNSIAQNYHYIIPGGFDVPQTIFDDPPYPLLWRSILAEINFASNFQSDVSRSKLNWISLWTGKCQMESFRPALDISLEFAPLLLYAFFYHTIHNLYEQFHSDILQDPSMKQLHLKNKINVVCIMQ